MKLVELLKAILNSPKIRSNAAQVVIVVVAAVTGAIIADRIESTETVEIIDTEVL
jgi:hypothetical protein